MAAIPSSASHRALALAATALLVPGGSLVVAVVAVRWWRARRQRVAAD